MNMEAGRRKSRRRSTWGAPAGLGDGEFLMRGAAITTGLPGKDGRLCQCLRETERERVSGSGIKKKISTDILFWGEEKTSRYSLVVHNMSPFPSSVQLQ